MHGHMKSSSGRLSGCYWAVSLPFIVSHQVPGTRHRKRRGTSEVEKESNNFKPIKTQKGKRGSRWVVNVCFESTPGGLERNDGYKQQYCSFYNRQQSS